MTSKNKKSIWIINQYAVLPSSPGGTRHFDFAKEFAKKKLFVTIFASGFNNFNKKETQNYSNKKYRTEHISKKFRFIWIKTPPYKSNNLSRLFNMISFASNFYKISKQFRTPDLIIGSSPHLFCAYSALKIAKIKRIPFIFEVRDIWPQNLIELGLSKYSPFMICLKKLERILISKSDKIVALMPYFQKYAQENFNLKAEKVSWISNGVSDQLIKKYKKTNNKKFIITYAGTLGKAQNLKIVLNCASKLKERRLIKFLIIGEGVEKQKLISLAKRLKLDNVTFKDPVSKRNIFKILGNSDALLFSQKKADIYRYGHPPNKIFDYMAAGRPIIFASGSKNNPVKKASCGISIKPESEHELSRAILTLYAADKNLLKKMGGNGQVFVKKHYSISQLAKKYFSIISSLIAK